MQRVASAFLCGLALAASVGTARAGLFDDEEARKRIAELRKELQQSVDALGKRVDAATQNQLDFANQAEALRADVARLTGQVEVLANSLESAHKRQQDFYVDLDNRLRKLEGGQGAPADGGAKPAEPPSDPQAEMRDYEAALGHFRAAKFKEAQGAFEVFIGKYAKSSLAPNAHYWLGSSLYQQKQFVKAAEAFGLVAATWPADAKAPDALLAQANALSEAKDTKAATRALEILVDKYPASGAAATARTRLKTLAPQKKR